MTKRTDTWVLYHSRPVFKTEFRTFPTETINTLAGTRPTLLSGGKVIDSPPRKDLNQEPMRIVLTDTIPLTDARDNMVKNYCCKYFETPKAGLSKSDFTDIEWQLFSTNLKVIEFIQVHLEVSCTNLLGEQLNSNFPRDMADYYILENMDAKEEQKAAQTRLLSELKHELSIISKDPEEFTNLAYQMAIDPTLVSVNHVYNILAEKIEQDPVLFERALKDADRWYKTVISRALRTRREGKMECYISEHGDGEIKNYLMDGVHIAQGMTSLVGYFKDHQKVFEGLEFQLGVKKKAGIEQTTVKSETEEDEMPETPTAKRGPGGRSRKQEVPS